MINNDQLRLGRYQGQLLLAPLSFFSLSEVELDLLTNGCGPEGYARVIPDRAWGHNLKPLCNIHDYMYKACMGLLDELIADAVFAFNMILSVLMSEGGKLLKTLRMARAFKYILAVSLTTYSDCYWEENKGAARHSRFIESSYGGSVRKGEMLNE